MACVIELLSTWVVWRFPVLAARCECLHVIKIDCLALRLDESAHACTRSELRGASCEDWKSALRVDRGASRDKLPRLSSLQSSQVLDMQLD